MEIADDALKDDLGMTRDEFEGAYAMWRVGADEGTLAETFKCSCTALSWYFIMRSAGDNPHLLMWPGPRVG